MRSPAGQSRRIVPPAAHFPPILFLFLPIFPLSICYKILVISPATSASHLILNGRLADSLAKDGHNVTLLELEFINPLGKFNASKLAKTTRIHGPFVPAGQISILRRKLVERAFQAPSLISNLLHHRAFQNLLINACEELIKTRKYELEELKKEHFEVVISEQITFCGSGLSHLLGVPIHILLNSGPMHESVASIIGVPLPSSWVPSASIASEHSDKMSLADRFVSFCRSILLKIWFAYNGIEIDELTRIFRKHFGPQFPDIIQIARESPLILVNTDEFVDFPRPTFPMIGWYGSW